jgi:uncharacterized protein YndB with AHSA1/START domain
MSYEIRHEIGVKASPEKIYDALTNVKKLSQWWTSDTRGESKIGGTLEFWFGDFCQKFKVTELKPGQFVHWKADGGMDEWDSTEITFTLEKDEGQTWIKFNHYGWQKNEGMLPHCSTKWAVFMLSLKELLEKGKGHPAPDDIEINHL